MYLIVVYFSASVLALDSKLLSSCPVWLYRFLSLFIAPVKNRLTALVSSNWLFLFRTQAQSSRRSLTRSIAYSPENLFTVVGTLCPSPWTHRAWTLSSTNWQRSLWWEPLLPEVWEEEAGTHRSPFWSINIVPISVFPETRRGGSGFSSWSSIPHRGCGVWDLGAPPEGGGPHSCTSAQEMSVLRSFLPSFQGGHGFGRLSEVKLFFSMLALAGIHELEVELIFLLLKTFMYLECSISDNKVFHANWTAFGIWI